MATAALSASSLSAFQPSRTPPNNDKANLKSEDFISLLITQLQNQDPLEPMKNQELLSQVSQIGQLQSQQTLTTGISDMVLQNQVSAASGMIGKMVVGLDANGDPLKGVVTSIKVTDKKVTLELDSGKTLQLSRVTGVAQSPVTPTTPPPTGNTGSNNPGPPTIPGGGAQPPIEYPTVTI